MFMDASKKFAILPAITGGYAYTLKDLGQLINNTVYIQVNSTRFADYSNVNISLAKSNLYVKPGLNIFWDLNSKTQLRLTGSYLFDYDLSKNIRFSGKDNSGKSISETKDTDSKNLSYYVNGSKSSSIPFNIRGFEAVFGVAVNLGKDKSNSAKK